MLWIAGGVARGTEASDIAKQLITAFGLIGGVNQFLRLRYAQPWTKRRWNFPLGDQPLGNQGRMLWAWINNGFQK